MNNLANSPCKTLHLNNYLESNISQNMHCYIYFPSSASAYCMPHLLYCISLMFFLFAVYPTLDLSDDEAEHVFKPRGRPKKDETWNPKAKLAPNCPKPERPQREGTRKESVESGLAAAAARLAHMPVSMDSIGNPLYIGVWRGVI